MDAQRSKPTGESGRALLSLALVVLAATTAAAFGRVFEGSPPSARLVLIAIFATAIAVALERRHLALSLLVSGAGLAIALGLLVFPRTTWHSLPTLDTWDALTRALGRLGEQATEEVAPAPALPSLFGASIIAVWASSYASHALAARAKSAILALVPPAALVAFASVAADDGARFGYAAMFLLSCLGVLFASGILELQGWGPLLPRRSYQWVRIASGPSGRAARHLGLAVVAAAVLLPGVLPGFRADALVDLAGSGDRISISPLVDIRPNLLADPAVELFTVEADRPAYWRLLSLDEYTGRFWRPTNPDADGGAVYQEQAVIPVASGAGGRFLKQEFDITNLGGTTLPAAYTPVQLNVPGQSFRHDPAESTFIAFDGIPADLRYRVTSGTPEPDAELLDRVLDSDFDAAGLPARYTQLPADTPVEVREVAQEITSDEPSPFSKARAIQDLLRSFTYDEQAPAGHGIDDLLFFLQSRRGYCEQFAGTMAVLLRSLGYPARVAVGFLPGTPDEDGVYHVTTKETHSWVEMFFPGFGWLAFEPTPTRSNPVASAYLNPPVESVGSTGQGLDALSGGILGGGRGGRGGAGQRDALDARLERLEALGLGALDPDTLPAQEENGGRSFPWVPVALLVLGIASALLLLVPLARTLARRLSIRRARTPADKVLASYRVFELGATDAGIGRGPAETMEEYRRRLRDAVRFSDGHLERLTALAGRALYEEAPLSGDDADEARVAAGVLVRDVRRHVGMLRALGGFFNPAGGA